MYAFTCVYRHRNFKECGEFEKNRGRFIAAIAALLVWVVFCCATSALAAPQAPQNLRITDQSFIVGLGPNNLSNVVNQNLTKELNPDALRIAFNHGDHDAYVNFAFVNNKTVVFMLGYGEGCPVTTSTGRQCYANRSAELADKYKNKVQYWEVWNEWNGNFGPYGGFSENNVRFEEYTDLLCKTYKAIKAVRPDAKIAGGVIAGANEKFLIGMLSSGAGNCMDILSLHIYPYRKDWPGHVAEDAPGIVGAQKVVQVVTDRNNLVKQMISRSIPIIISETGLPVTNFPESLQSDYLTAVYKELSSLVEGVWWFILKDFVRADGDIAKAGLVRLDNSKRPAFEAFKALPKK